MSDPIPPVDPPEERKEKEPFEEFPEGLHFGRATIFLLTWLMLLFKETFNIFVFHKAEAQYAPEKRERYRALRLLKGLFSELREKDESMNPIFLQELSVISQKITPEDISLFSDYPPDADYTFATYLEKHAGTSWFPLPFIEILRSLHHEKKTLGFWIEKIDEALTK